VKLGFHHIYNKSMVGIYKITNPNNKLYIGCTINWGRRLKEYKNLRVKGQSKIYESLMKYGWVNHHFEFIEECSINEIYAREIFYIEKYNSIEEGLNIRLGGRNGKLTQQTKNKISAKLKGRKTWNEGKKCPQISKPLKEHYKDPKNREKLKVPRKRNKDNKCWDRNNLIDPFLVEEIRTKFISGKFTKSDLSREYGVSWGTIKNIVDKINSYKD